MGGGQLNPDIYFKKINFIGNVAHKCVCVSVLSHIRLFATPGTVAHQASLFMEFSRQEYWSRLLRGASSTPGKGHEEGGLAYAKAGSSLRSLPGNSQAIYPQNQSLPTFCFVLSPTPLTL